MNIENINALNERSLTSLEQGMMEYPPNLPHEVHQTIREAISAYKDGDRSSEVVLCLSIAMTQACINVLRFKLCEGVTSLGARLTF